MFFLRRGIPAGISFPKDFFSSDGKHEIQDSSQAPPLNQRHTYFQDVHHGNPHRSLRRVIKPPARFKNSRMSLRPVHRPVLCAKCGVRCEDKSVLQGNKSDVEPSTSVPVDPANGTGSSTGNAGNGSNQPKKNGVTRKKAKAEKQAIGNSSTTKRPDNNSSISIPPLLEDPKDFCYESVGCSGILENTWKRPLAKPLRTQSRPGGTKGSQLTDFETKVTINGRMPVLVPATNASSSKTNLSFCDMPQLQGPGSDKLSVRIHDGNPYKSSKLSCKLENSDSSSAPIFRITKPPSELTKLSNDNMKVNNLKLCISKISCGRRKLENVVLRRTQSLGNPLFVTKKPSSETYSLSAPGLNGTGGRSKVRKRIAKTPLRFRDQNYPFNLDPNICRAESGILDSISQTSEDSLIKSSLNEENCDNNHIETINPAFKDNSEDRVLSDEAKKRSRSVSGNSIPSEPVKTPVLKIFFDSKGSGMVVQVPPKVVTPCIQSGPGVELVESKAARKAMKKAKKEARKKHLPDPFPANNALLPLTLQTSCSVDQQKTSLLPSPQAYNSAADYHLPSSATESNAPDLTDWLSMSSDLEQGSSSHPTKKRKKVKRKRKEKRADKTRSDDSRRSTSSTVLTPSPAFIDHEDMVSSSTTIPSTSGTSSMSSHYALLSPGSDTRDVENKEQSEAHERVLLSLKRLDRNAYTTVTKELDYLPTSTNKVAESQEEPSHSLLGASAHIDPDGSVEAESLEFYLHEKSNQTYKKGDVVWGQNKGMHRHFQRPVE
jgi:hypothetical protein